MLYTSRETENTNPDEVLYFSLVPVIRGMGMNLIELSFFRGKGRSGKPGSVQIKAVVCREGTMGLEDCSRVHRGILPRLELSFPEQDIYLEVSSPGIDRNIKDASEFAFYTGKAIKCFRTDISDWTAGILKTADEKKIVIRLDDKETIVPFEVIAKARLDG